MIELISYTQLAAAAIIMFVWTLIVWFIATWYERDRAAAESAEGARFNRVRGSDLH